jgi:hypothetical protein
MSKINWLIMALALGGSVMAGCQPKTTSEKIKDKVEDASHETGQAIERAGEKVKDGVN